MPEYAKNQFHRRELRIRFRREEKFQDNFEGERQSPFFDPHLAGNPDTVGHMHVNYEPFPGSLMSQRNIFTSTLTLGIGDQFEIGAVPIYYFLNTMEFISWNVTAKYNIIRLPNISFAVGYSFSYFEFAIAESIATEELDGAKRGYVSQHGASIFSAITLSPRLSAGLTLSGSTSYALFTFKDETSKDTLYESNHWHEVFTDLSYKWDDSLSISGGLSRTLFTRDLQDASDRHRKFELGFGSTVTWHRPNQFFSKPSIGVHRLTEAKRNLILLSTTFY